MGETINVKLNMTSHAGHWYQDRYVYNQNNDETYGPAEIIEDNEIEYLWSPAHGIRIMYYVELFSDKYSLNTVQSFNSLTVKIKTKAVMNDTPCHFFYEGDNIPGGIKNGYGLVTGATTPYQEDNYTQLPNNATYTHTVTFNRNDKDNRDWIVSDLDKLRVLFDSRICIPDEGPWDANWRIIYFLELTVNVTLIPAAAVTTEAATQISYMCAMGNGEAVGDNITERGFEIKVDVDYFGVGGDISWGMIGFADVGDLVVDMGGRSGSLTKTERETGEFESGAFELVLGRPDIFGYPTSAFNDALKACRSYTYRAYAIISGETYHGDYVAFNTLCYGAGEKPDDVISSLVPTVEPLSLTEEEIPFWEWPEIVFPPWAFPPWQYPPFVHPPWEFPNMVFPPWQDPTFNWSPEAGIDPDITFGRTFSAFMRRLDTKKDWKTLREKCIIYQENMNQFTLTVNHNMLVLKNLVNDIIAYVDENVYPSDLKLVDSCQQLTPLYLEPISPNGFKDIINDFRLKDTYNVHNLNVNFRKLLNSLNSLYESDYGVKPISYNASEYLDIQPTAKRMILQLDDMNEKSREVRKLIVLNIRRIFTYV